jgi:hypothetical protein
VSVEIIKECDLSFSYCNSIGFVIPILFHLC